MKEKQSQTSKPNSSKGDQGKKKQSFFASRGILSNLLLMVIITFAIIFAIQFGIGLYTRHNKNITIPALQGKPLSEAIRILEMSSLNYQVVDSIYSKTEPAGTIYDVTPKSGHKVKPGRIIFLSIYTREPRKQPIPSVDGISGRSAVMLLRNLGFEKIETKIVSTGMNNDECQGIELPNGRLLKTGELIPITQTVVVLVKGTILDSLNAINLIDTISTEDSYDDPTSTEVDSTGRKPSKPTKDPEQWW